MSVTNKTYDRDQHGQLKRKYRGPTRRMSTPMWWIREFMNQPRRAENRRLCHQVTSGKDPDNITWPLGNCKPHLYYW